MFFLLRLLFWFALVLFFLPLGTGTIGDGRHQVGALEAVSAAKRAVEDLAGMCERDPEICVTGKAALQRVGERARDSAQAAIDTLDDKLEPQAPVVDAQRPDAPVIPVPTARPQQIKP